MIPIGFYDQAIIAARFYDQATIAAQVAEIAEAGARWDELMDLNRLLLNKLGRIENACAETLQAGSGLIAISRVQSIITGGETP